ncbi:hypothetical protein GOP47_0014173 [Adiantum capillus-veneris]|uniref:Uncharacterized protein n=1 Tax=Adiantum capillus-veneris TaxID=13818 RepID=A0A9D4UQX0_ADICA|nr:hypothetical protein GOP47_0014173 [Adiantum capillus-veneris]
MLQSSTLMGMDDEEFLSSLSPQQTQWYVEHHRSGASSRIPTPSASPSLSKHSALSEASVSTRRSSHSSRHRRSSGGGGGCCGDSAADASTPPRVRRGSLPSPSLPIPTSSPSTPGFARLIVPSSYTPLPSPPGATPLDTPRFRAQTPMETPDVRTPIHTPLETPAGTPRFTHHRPEGLSYSVDFSEHKRSEVQKEIKHGWNRPDWLAKEDWKNVKKAAHENPDKWKQQKDAARARVEAGSSHHLGSGEWASFEADFVSFFALLFMFDNLGFMGF